MSYQPPILPVETESEVAYSQRAVDGREALLSLPLRELFHRLMNGYESDSVLPACQYVGESFFRNDLFSVLLDAADARPFVEHAHVEEIVADKSEFRRVIRTAFRGIADIPMAGDARASRVLLHRSPNALTEPCWLDNVSQPGTQPATLINDLFKIYCNRLGRGDFARSAHRRFRELCARHGIFPPETASSEFCRDERVGDYAYLAAVYHLAIGRHPRLFFPAIMGTTIAHYMLHLDPIDGEFDTDDVFDQCADMLSSFAALSTSVHWPSIERRIVRGFYTEAKLEYHFWKRTHEALRRYASETPRDRIGDPLKRIGSYADDHYKDVLFEGKPVRGWLPEGNEDPCPFVDALGDSEYFADSDDPGMSGFLSLSNPDAAIFAIFSKSDAKIIEEWAEASKDRQIDVRAAEGTADDGVTLTSFRALTESAGGGNISIRCAVKPDGGDCSTRELFYRLINIDLHPYVLPRAKAYAADVLRQAEVHLADGTAAKYSDATFFDYTPQALERRVERVYFDKLINGYEPIAKMPPKERVLAMQKMMALGNLIDGTWIHKIGKVGQYDNRAAGYLFGIYADEMGYGDMRLNHIMVMRRALDSMGIELPEMAARAYAYNKTVPARSFAFLVYELALSQFPQTYFAESLGLNLAIEMFGLGAFRLDEIRKLKHYGFDDGYERLHLTIDNIVTGHVNVGIRAIQAYLDDIQLRLGRAGVEQMWRRIWLGYASLVQFVERLGSEPSETLRASSA